MNEGQMKELKNPQIKSSKQMTFSMMASLLVGDFLSLCIPFILFMVVLVVPLPNSFLNASRYNYWLFGGAATILLYFAFSYSGKIGRTLSLSSVLIIFSLPLVRLWNTGASENFVTGGLMPFSDAAVYYFDARSILQGGTMGEWGGQRPLFTGLFAALLKLTQFNLQAAFAILTALNAVSAFFTAREIQKSHGAVAAAFITVGIFFFFRPFSGQVLTESLGIALGLLSFAALWRGIHQREMLITLCGIFLLSFALNARMGTVFVLPVLTLWGSYYFRKSQRLSWKFLVGSCGLVVVATLLNLLLLKVVGLPNGSPPLANFAFTLYGLATHTTWYQPYLDHPELMQLGGIARNEAIYAYALDFIYRNPLALITGFLKAWREFFVGQYAIFLWDGEFGLSGRNMDTFLRFNAFLGLIICLRQRRKPLFSFMLAYALGAFLTIPFLPIWDAGIRPYAVTIVILYAYAMLGFLLILKNIVRPVVSHLYPKTSQSSYFSNLRASFLDFTGRESLYPQVPSALPMLGILLCLCCVAAPIYLKLRSSIPTLPSVTCPAGAEVLYFRVNQGSYIHLVKNNSIGQTKLPYVKIRDFNAGLDTFSPWAKVERTSLRRLEGATTIISEPGAWIVADTSIFPKRRGWFFACGQSQNYGLELRLFYADTIQALSPS